MLKPEEKRTRAIEHLSGDAEILHQCSGLCGCVRLVLAMIDGGLRCFETCQNHTDVFSAVAQLIACYDHDHALVD